MFEIDFSPDQILNMALDWLYQQIVNGLSQFFGYMNESGYNLFAQPWVAAYCRVSTDEEEQLNSFEVQCQYYTELIESKEEWQLVKIFADEGKTGTQMKQRADFLKMMRYARQGKIDIILIVC